MKLFITLFAVILFLNASYAQDAMTYNWGEPIYDISEEDAEKKGIILKDFRSIYFKKANGPYIRINNKTKTIHKRIYVNSNEVIENYNKVFIPTRDVKDVNRLQVRSINKDGNVTDFDINNLKILDNIEGYGEFTIFAIEGIQKGAIIEYMYEFEMFPSFYGSELFQFDLPTKYAELYLYGKGLEFDSKGYNGATIKTIKDGRKNNIYGGVMRNIPAFREESYAANHANKLRVDYVVRGFDWEGLSQSLTRYTYTNSDLRKQITAILDKEIGLKNIESKSEKISAIEQYVKDNYTIVQDYSADFSDVEKIVETKFASETGITFLFAALFNSADIDYELVASCDRFNRKFDREFPTPYNLDYLIFYFSDLRKFVSPYPFEYKNGLIPDYLLTQKGFSVASTYNKVNNSNHRFRFLDINNKKEFKTKVIEDITVHLTENEDPFISVMIELQGYRALDFISIYNQVALDKRKDFTTFFVPQSLANQVNPNKLTLNGSSTFSENIEEDYVTIYAELPAEQFIEKAGQSIIFKLGDLIGKQMELYQEEERTQDIELNYPVDYDRTITFNYDEGFTVEGQEEIVIETNQMSDELKELMGFYSSYNDDGKQLKINIDEYYHFVHMDKKHYFEFRDVINAAADFNKVYLLITYN